MHTHLEGARTFEPIEGQLVFRVETDTFGHVGLEGELFKTAGEWSVSVKFSVSIDQTYLPDISRSLDALLA